MSAGISYLIPQIYDKTQPGAHIKHPGLMTGDILIACSRPLVFPYGKLVYRIRISTSFGMVPSVIEDPNGAVVFLTVGSLIAFIKEHLMYRTVTNGE